MIKVSSFGVFLTGVSLPFLWPEGILDPCAMSNILLSTYSGMISYEALQKLPQKLFATGRGGGRIYFLVFAQMSVFSFYILLLAKQQKAINSRISHSSQIFGLLQGAGKSDAWKLVH
jgi:hypothetical protein